MLSRQAKAAFFAFAGPLMKLNGVIYRRLRAPRSGDVKVHLGPGQKNYISGWINIDANIFTGKADLWADLRNPLPFDDNSCDAFYSHHMIEHLPNMESHLSEVLRCLKPGGIYRVGGPNGDSAIAKFVEGDPKWFGGFPDDRKSVGGRLENFIFCRQEHLTLLTLSFVTELLGNAGFGDIKKCDPVRESTARDMFSDCLTTEEESDYVTPHTLIVEAVKPATPSSNVS